MAYTAPAGSLLPRFMAIHPSLLLQFGLLRSLTESQINSLAARSSTQEFGKREVVLHKDEPPKHLCLLLVGKLQALDFTLDGKEVGIYFIDEGQHFGEIAMLDGQLQPEMVIATKRSQVVMVPAQEVREHVFGAPAAIEALTLGLTVRLRRQTRQRQLLAITNPLQRICMQLEALSHIEAGRRLIQNAPTHQEIAIMVNLTRETVTRTFQVLQSQGALDREGDNLVIDLIKTRNVVEKPAG